MVLAGICLFPLVLGKKSTQIPTSLAAPNSSMAMLTFLPWLTLNEPLKLKEFHLLQYKRRFLPVGQGKPLQETLDRLLKPYRHLEKPVESATILQLAGRQITDDLSDSEREEIFTLSELITFSGLSRREYFGLGMFYCNADNFICVVQSFQGETGGAAVTTRRRDGQTLGYFSADAYKIHQPLHVRQGFERTHLDVPLLKALLSARKEKWWGQLFDAIFWFNHANTDSDTIRPEVEAVKMVSSFEQSLGRTRGKERELRKAFVTGFVPNHEMPYSASERSKSSRMEGCASVRDAWIADFFRLRGDHAHGRRKAHYKSAWALNEHLILGSYAFPLLVKSLLAKHRLYALVHDDRIGIDCFERIASMPIFEKQLGSDDVPWNRIRVEAELAAPYHEEHHGR